MNKKRALFIVNPISGTGKQRGFQQTLINTLNLSKYHYDLEYTRYCGHAMEISAAECSNYDLVVAVGGDGTVNEVAAGMVNSKGTMAIIPLGSGNGLARHLRIPMGIKEAIEIINIGDTLMIDTATLNGKQFFNVSGIGFDAHVAHKFATAPKRGAIPYAKIAAVEFQKYESKYYSVVIGGETRQVKAFLISFANSAQFGNNAYISPNAIINDGLLDVCILSEFPKVEAGQLAIKLFNKRLDKSKYMTICKTTSVKVISDDAIYAHIDGEPIVLPNIIEVEINPKALNVIVNNQPNIIDLLSQKIKKL